MYLPQWQALFFAFDAENMLLIHRKMSIFLEYSLCCAYM